MKKLKSLLVNLLITAMVVTMLPVFSFGAVTSVSDFRDMPNDWSTDALQKAVSNGLISGFDEYGIKYIKPNDNLTRAQMATIVNRAFGADKLAALSWVNDVPASEWFAPEMAKAVKMGTFKLDTYMRPNDPITRQEAFTVLARALKFTDKDNGNSLHNFTDGSKVADFAVDSVCAMIDGKYVAGSNGYLYPASNMSRAEFAKVMDNLIKDYVGNTGEVYSVSSLTGNLMINAPSVTIKNTIIKGDLIIGDGVGTGNVTLDNVDVTGRTIIRGGGLNTVRIKSNCDIPNITIAKVDGNVRVLVDSGGTVDLVNIDDGDDDVILEGNFGTVNVNQGLPVYFVGAEVNLVQVTVTATINVDKDSVIDRMNVVKSATGTKAVNYGIITKLVSDIKVTVSGTGTVTENLATGGNVALISIGTISGTPKVGVELTVGTIKPSGATVNYQWKRANTTNGTYSNISGATSRTYTPVGDDLNKFIKVAITGKTNYTGTLTSNATTVVTASKITATTIVAVTVPVMGAAPVSSLASTAEYTATITWSPVTTHFAAATVYTATIVLTPKTGYTLTGITVNQFKVAGAASATNPVNSGTITALFPAIPTVTKVTATSILGVTPPVIGATPVTNIESAEYTGIVLWNPIHTVFNPTTVYTATITLSPKSGYTLNGVSANQFTVTGANATNSANSGVITAVFSATPPLVRIDPTSLSIAAPEVGAVPTASLNTAQFTAGVSWSPTAGTFAASTSYTATITLTPKSGFTTLGISENQFSVSDATTVTNSANSEIITVVFPATQALSKISIINISGVIAPATGATPVSSLEQTSEYTLSLIHISEPTRRTPI